MCDMPYSYARQDLLLLRMCDMTFSLLVCVTRLTLPSREWHDVLMPYIRVGSFHSVAHSTQRLCVCGISNSLLVCVTTHLLLISVT